MTEDEPTEGTAVRRDRFSGGPARSFLSSIAADEQLFAADLAVDRAHVIMLAEQGIISNDEAATILDALTAVEEAGYDALPNGEDVHEAIESAVIDQIGPIGGKMHTARSRNDEVATCIRYALRPKILEMIDTILEIRAGLIDIAEQTDELVMPGYTHLQSAQPTTVAHWHLSYEQAFARDSERFVDVYDRIDRCPLGAAAFGGTPFDIDRKRTAALLGFGQVMDNSMDAVSTRDFILETIAASTAAATTAAGLAEDVIIFSNRGFVEIADDFASTSSIMPQKKNPDTLELVRATAGDTLGELTAVVTILKGLPRAYNRDLQRVTPHLWRSMGDLHQALKVVGGAITTATWNEETLFEAAGEGFSTATGVADLLAMHGIPFRTAHEIVATAAQQGASPTTVANAVETVTGSKLDDIVDSEQVESVLDVAANVRSRNSLGGPAPVAVRSAIERAQAQLESERAVHTDLVSELESATAQLQREVMRFD